MSDDEALAALRAALEAGPLPGEPVSAWSPPRSWQISVAFPSGGVMLCGAQAADLPAAAAGVVILLAGRPGLVLSGQEIPDAEGTPESRGAKLVYCTTCERAWIMRALLDEEACTCQVLAVEGGQAAHWVTSEQDEGLIWRLDRAQYPLVPEARLRPWDGEGPSPAVTARIARYGS